MDKPIGRAKQTVEAKPTANVPRELTPLDFIKHPCRVLDHVRGALEEGLAVKGYEMGGLTG